MNEYQKMYQDKLTTAEEAVKLVKSGDWVDFGWCVGHPDALDKALAARMPELYDVKIRGGIWLRRPAIFDVPNAAEHFCWNSWHMSGIERKAIDEGIAFYGPMRYSELPGFYRSGNIARPDVVMIQVAPMDNAGFFNFGPEASHLAAVCETAKVVIVEVNKNMPRCLGGFESDIHISDVDFIVEGTNPMPGQIGSVPPTEVDEIVAKMIVEQIPNGACLQLGIGGMPNTVGSLIAQSDLKDLGVHTEMYVDAFVDLAMAGKINGSKKNIDKGRQVYGFGAGTQKLYDYLNNNPACMSAPTSYTNDVRVISQLDNFMSINNAVNIDLYGQVSAESSGIRHISGAGGQLDFVMGAYLSKGGKSFICLSSTFTDKKGVMHSRICPTLPNGEIVTDTRANTNYVVTEYGMVNLKGLNTWERAEALISIAHPDFREELIKGAEAQKIWRKTNRR